MRMCLPSTSRQPCRVGSCMAVTRKRPSGLNVTSRCEPFHSSFSGLASGALGNQSVAPLYCATASRKPLGANASPPALDGRSIVRAALSLAFVGSTKACLPTAHATPSSVTATRSIQRRLASVAIVSGSPLASVATTLPSSPPVTMRLPSLAAPRIPPPCTATRRSAPSRQNSSDSSPSTNTASSPRKCTAMTAPPAATGWMRSAMDGVAVGTSLIRLCHALGETLADHLLGHVAADEHGAAHPLLAILPRPLMVAVEDHVDALEDEALGVVL